MISSRVITAVSFGAVQQLPVMVAVRALASSTGASDVRRRRILTKRRHGWNGRTAPVLPRNNQLVLRFRCLVGRKDRAALGADAPPPDWLAFGVVIGDPSAPHCNIRKPCLHVDISYCFCQWKV